MPVYWAVKNLPTIGNTFDGVMENGEYGPRFKREFAMMQPSSGGTAQPFVNASSKTTTNDSREDGMRQGMCINNAANYVNALTALAKEPLSADQWANEVHEFANALYNKGNLVILPADDAAGVSPEDLDSITALFDNPQGK